jgi:hypothetical protein
MNVECEIRVRENENSQRNWYWIKTGDSFVAVSGGELKW